MQNEAQRKNSKCVDIQVETALAATGELSTDGRISMDRSLVPGKPRLTSAVIRERIWFAVLVVLFLSSSSLSIASLTRRSADWLVSKQGQSFNRVGWQNGCLDRIERKGEVPHVIPCSSDGATESLEHLVSHQAGALGLSIFVVSVVAWVLPVALIFGTTYCEATRGTCCHGFTIATLWILSGAALIALTLTFRNVIDSDATLQHRPRWSVDCLTDFNQVVPVCTDVTALEDCLLTCRVTPNGVVCAGFHQCRLTERDANCKQDGVECGLEMGWAMHASLTSSALLTFMGGFVGLGSWFLSKTF